ncbi:hypothetical protein GCM10009557_34050 [Virgisporangium ochraceum]
MAEPADDEDRTQPGQPDGEDTGTEDTAELPGGNTDPDTADEGSGSEEEPDGSGEEPSTAPRGGSRSDSGSRSDGARRSGPTRTRGHGDRDDLMPSQFGNLINIFQDQVRAGTIGQSGASPGDQRRRNTARKMNESEVTADLRYYCRPDRWGDAVERLQNDHVVVLCGRTGLGKRAGAVNLLREVTHGQLVVMSATSDLKHLAARKYQKDFGYLVINQVDTATSEDHDFAWRDIREQVRNANAYLVVTTVLAADTKVDSVRHFDWQRPDLHATLVGFLADHDVELDDEVIARVVAETTIECSMAEFADVARRLAEREPHEKILETFGETCARRVQDWFDEPREAREIVEVAVLAFIEGVSNRELDWMHRELAELLEKHGAMETRAKPARKGTDPPALVTGRRHRVLENSLMVERHVAGYTADRRVLEFRSRAYRRHVLIELSRRYPNPFWDAIAQWLCGIVLQQDQELRVAEGLALLAAVDFDEVEGAYLHPWSKGQILAPGQVTAVYTLWWMCYAEDTMPVALKIAKQWANHGTPKQRWAAAMVYSGELGACDPAHSIKQLWNLIIQSAQGYEEACYAMALLFATLTRSTEEAGKVLTTLERQLDRPITRPQDVQVVQRARVSTCPTNPSGST